MKIKRILAVFAVSLAITGLLSSCIPDVPVATPLNTPGTTIQTEENTWFPTVTPESTPAISDWAADKDYHWLVKANGDSYNKTLHDFGEEGCKVCGMVVLDSTDGMTYAVKPNEYGHIVLYSIYKDRNSEKPLVLLETEFVYSYDGELISSVTFEWGKLYEECKYAKSNRYEGVDYYKSESIIYNSDGTKTLRTYDDYTFITRYSEYDENDVLIEECIYENFYDENNERTLVKTFKNGRLTMEEYYTCTEYISYISKEIIYNEDGTTTVNEYDDNGFFGILG